MIQYWWEVEKMEHILKGCIKLNFDIKAKEDFIEKQYYIFGFGKY